MLSDCTLVLPCKDEARALPALLAAVPAGLPVLVVDNGSVDGTAEVARAHGAGVVIERRPGYGAAVHAGLEAAATTFVAVMDGDGSFDPEVVPGLLNEVAEDRADLVVGRRRPVRPGIWPWHARWGNALVLAWLRHRTGISVHDIGPVRVFRRAPMLGLGIGDRRFGYPVELLVRAQAAGWRITERDVDYHPRAQGTRSKVSGSVRGTFRAARDFAKALP